MCVLCFSLGPLTALGWLAACARAAVACLPLAGCRHHTRHSHARTSHHTGHGRGKLTCKLPQSRSESAKWKWQFDSEPWLYSRPHNNIATITTLCIVAGYIASGYMLSCYIVHSRNLTQKNSIDSTWCLGLWLAILLLTCYKVTSKQQRCYSCYVLCCGWLWLYLYSHNMAT